MARSAMIDFVFWGWGAADERSGVACWCGSEVVVSGDDGDVVVVVSFVVGLIGVGLMGLVRSINVW